MTLGEVYPFVDGASPCGRAAKRAGRGRERFMAERKRKQKKGFSALAVRIGLVCVCIYLCVSLVFAQIDIVSKRQQLENLTQQVAAQEAANTELQRTLDSGDEARATSWDMCCPASISMWICRGTDCTGFGKHCGFAIFITLFNVRSYRNPWQ